MVVQFRVVALARVAPAHRLDGAERYHAVAGPGAGARLDGRVHGAGHDRPADRPAFRWAGVHGLAADGQYARLGRTAERFVQAGVVGPAATRGGRPAGAGHGGGVAGVCRTCASGLCPIVSEQFVHEGVTVE